ncbi:MAG: integrase arm-type DNA-binding domain-containing protein [Rhodospirillales bacterium]
MPELLTKLFVKNLKPTDKQVVYLCTDPKGFGIRINPNGSRTWIYNYTDKNGRRPKYKIGRYPDLELGRARTEAKKIAGMVANGEDPAKEKREDRRARAKSSLGMNASRPVTMEDCMELFITNRIKVRYKPKTKADGTQIWEEEQMIRKHVIPRIGDLEIVDFRRSDAKAMQRAITGQGGARVAVRAVDATRAALNWLADEEIVEDAPTFRNKSTRNKRTRVLRDDEIRMLWNACDEAPRMYGAYIKMLLLTAQRRAEVAGMKWSAINEKEWTWTTKVKSSKAEAIEVVVPLSPLAQQVLQSLPREGDHVFPSRRGDGPFSGFSSARKFVEEKLEKPIDGWTFHDLRRTCRTNLPRLKVLPDVAEAVIGHKKQGLDAVYNQYEYLDEKREALEKWADLILEIITPTDDDGKAVHLRPASA